MITVKYRGRQMLLPRSVVLKCFSLDGPKVEGAHYSTHRKLSLNLKNIRDRSNPLRRKPKPD